MRPSAAGAYGRGLLGYSLPSCCPRSSSAFAARRETTTPDASRPPTFVRVDGARNRVSIEARYRFEDDSRTRRGVRRFREGQTYARTAPTPDVRRATKALRGLLKTSSRLSPRGVSLSCRTRLRIYLPESWDDRLRTFLTSGASVRGMASQPKTNWRPQTRPKSLARCPRTARVQTRLFCTS